MDGVHVALLARGFDELTRRVSELPETDDPAADLVRVGVERFADSRSRAPTYFASASSA